MDEITIEQITSLSPPIQCIYEGTLCALGAEVKSVPKLPGTEISESENALGEVKEAAPARSKLQLAAIMTMLYVCLLDISYCIN